MPGHPAVPLQVVLTTYGSPLELLKDFDVDCCCFAFIPSDEKVVATSRGVRAVRHSTNICDSSFDSAVYCRRLEKYDMRGYAIGVPGFEPHRLPERLRASTYAYHGHHDVLTRLCPDGGEPVRHFERLLVLKYAAHKIRTHAQPVSVCDTESDSDCEEYSPVPHVAVTTLLEKCQAHEDDTPLPGGFVAKGAGIGQSQLTAKLCVAAHLPSQSHLHFVYDFCTVETPFASLRFVRDAARPPLDDADGPAFKRAYGIDRRLTFSEAGARERRAHDWWTVYD